MPQLPLAVRVVEVIADCGEGTHPRYRYGSGCIVAGRTVLTAAHVVTGAASVRVRGSDKVMHEARLDLRFVGAPERAQPDLALVEIATAGTNLPPMGLAAVDRNSPTGDPVERCHAIGYPAFMERDVRDFGRIRDTVDAYGHVPVLSRLAGGLLSVQVSSMPRELPPERLAWRDSEWSGMSGGPLVADGRLLGVVTEHAPREGPSTITVTPLTALEADLAHPGWGPGVADPAAWWARLGVSGLGELGLLPPRRRQADPAYWATVREIHQRTGRLIGRQRELADITSFAVGAEGYRWLVGDAWAGKTSLLAEAVAAALPGEVDAVAYFLSRREADADSTRFMAAVVPQLAYLVDEEPPIAELDQFRALWQRAAKRAAAENRHLLLIVDGLDEDLRPPGLPSVAAVLPTEAGDRVHVLVSSRPYPRLPPDLPVGHLLGRTQPVHLEPFAGAQAMAALARQEIDDLIRRDETGLAADVLGLLTAAAGPLAVEDLAAMTEVAHPSAALTRKIRQLFSADAARSLQSVGDGRYQFVHDSLLKHAHTHEALSNPAFRRRIHQWAQKWRDGDWPLAVEGKDGTPRYLLGTYPSTLGRDPQRLAALVSDAGWVDAAIQSAGTDRVLADLRRAVAAAPADPAVGAMLAAVVGQAHQLRLSHQLSQPGYVLRQLCLQAAELAEDELADHFRARLRSQPGPGLVPLWTTRRASSALSGELGRYDRPASALAVLPDGRLVSGGSYNGRVLVWDPAHPGTEPVELGCHGSLVEAVAVLPDGRVVSGGLDQRVLLWDPVHPGTEPVELGRHDGVVSAVAVLPDGRVVSGGRDQRRLVWDPAQPQTGPVELGRAGDSVSAVAVLPDGRVVSGGRDRRVLVWDPAQPGTEPVELGRHDGVVSAVAVLADGRVVSAGSQDRPPGFDRGSYDGRVLVWDPARPQAGSVELGRDDGPVNAVAVLADGRVVSAGGEGMFLQDEELVGGGSYNGRVLVWDPARPQAGPVELGRDDGPVNALAVLADGRVASAGAEGRILVWDPARPRTGPATLGHDGPVSAVAVLADGRVVSAGWDRRVLVWDPAGRRTGPVELGRHDGRPEAVAVLPDGRVVSGGFEEWRPRPRYPRPRPADRRVLVWDPARPKNGPVKLGRHDRYDRAVRALAVLPDGRVVSNGEDHRLLVWNPARRRADPVELGRHGGPVDAVAVLPDGRVVSGGRDHRLLVWNPARRRAGPVDFGRHDAHVPPLAVLPDGRVISGGRDQRVLVWDPAQPGTEPVQLGRHDAHVSAVAVLPDGRVVSGGEDDRVIVWDATTRTEIAQLGCSVTALATGSLGPGESYLVIAHKGAGISLWSMIGGP